MREPPITLSCDCGKAVHVAYGDRWTCPDCGRTWDTSQIPRDEYDQLLRSMRRYSLFAIGPPVALCVVLVPLAVLVGFQYAFLLFFLLLAYALLVMPRLRTKATANVLRHRATWKLSPE